MNTQQRTIVIVSLAMSLAVLGCAIAQSFASTPTPTSTETPIPLPSATSTHRPTPTPTPRPTPTPKPFAIQDTSFQQSEQDCETDINITSVEDDYLGFSVNTTITMLSGGWAVFCYGARHTWIGTLTYAGYTFSSDDADPLQFTVDQNKGYLYIGGSGTVAFPDGSTVSLGGAGPSVSAPPTSVDCELIGDCPVSFGNLYISDAFDDNSNEWSVGDVDGDWWVGTRLIENGVLGWGFTTSYVIASIPGADRSAGTAH